MKAAIVNRYGPADVLQYQDIQKPTIQPDQLLVQVQGSSVNPVDWKIREGHLQLLSGYQFPRVMGSDLSGIVVKVGSQVTQFRPGDEIYTFLNPLKGGAYAEYAAVSAVYAAKKPKNLSHTQAAVVPIAGLTALQSLIDLGNLKPRQKVLINGASGGVGTFAVQIAKALNAEVTGVCSAKNQELVRRLGADAIIDYTQTDFTQQPTQYDLILDAVGSRSFADCQKVLQPEGVYISTLPSLEIFGPLLLHSFLPGKKAKLIVAQPRSRDLDALRALIEADKIQPIVDRTYPLEAVAAAQIYSESGRVAGKIAIALEKTADV